jgi:hypothetical protein
LDRGPNGKGAKIRKLIEDKIRRKKLKNHVFFLCTTIPVFLSFYLQFPIWFPGFSCWIGELQTMFLLPHFKGNSWCLMVPTMEGKKGVVPSFDQWKLNAENQNMNQNILVSFLRFFYCKLAEICILELMH